MYGTLDTVGAEPAVDELSPLRTGDRPAGQGTEVEEWTRMYDEEDDYGADGYDDDDSDFDDDDDDEYDDDLDDEDDGDDDDFEEDLDDEDL